ncbi:unnamed protein product [Ectocarpus sp. 12 AP-2014]
MSVSGSKLAFSPKPPPQPSPQGGLAKQGVSAQDALVGSKRIKVAVDVGKGSTATAPPMAKTKPLRRKTLPVPVLEVSIVPEKRISGGPFRQDGVTYAAVDAETTSVAATAREPAAGDGGAARIGFRQLLSTKTPEQQLLRSGSAPDPSTTTLRIASKMTTGVPIYELAEVRPHLLPGRGKVECAPSELKVDLTGTTRSCWDESRDSVVPVEAVSRSQHGTTPTRGNTAAEPTAAKVLPLLSLEQELTGRGVGKLKQRLAPLHRRKSDAVDGRFRSRSRTLSSAQRKSASSGQEPSLARRRSTTPDASRPSTTSNTSTAREGMSSSRTSCSSETATDPGADQAQLKARLRVMEWKRRRAEELESQQEEQATLDHRKQVETDTEAARKLAAARAEEAERRILAERNNSVDAVRASEAAERWAKASRERERRRAEIYAINAVMRAAFEKEFKAYSLEQEKRVTQGAALDVPDLQPAVDDVTPPQR